MPDNLKEYENYLKFEKNYSMNTINSYLSDIKEYQEFKKGDILSSTKEDILAYLKTIIALKRDNTSIRFFSLAECAGMIAWKTLVMNAKENAVTRFDLSVVNPYENETTQASTESAKARISSSILLITDLYFKQSVPRECIFISNFKS